MPVAAPCRSARAVQQARCWHGSRAIDRAPQHSRCCYPLPGSSAARFSSRGAGRHQSGARSESRCRRPSSTRARRAGVGGGSGGRAGATAAKQHPHDYPARPHRIQPAAAPGAQPRERGSGSASTRPRNLPRSRPHRGPAYAVARARPRRGPVAPSREPCASGEAPPRRRGQWAAASCSLRCASITLSPMCEGTSS